MAIMRSIYRKSGFICLPIHFVYLYMHLSSIISMKMQHIDVYIYIYVIVKYFENNYALLSIFRHKLRKDDSAYLLKKMNRKKNF